MPTHDVVGEIMSTPCVGMAPSIMMLIRN